MKYINFILIILVSSCGCEMDILGKSCKREYLLVSISVMLIMVEAILVKNIINVAINNKNISVMQLLCGFVGYPMTFIVINYSIYNVIIKNKYLEIVSDLKQLYNILDYLKLKTIANKKPAIIASAVSQYFYNIMLFVNKIIIEYMKVPIYLIAIVISSIYLKSNLLLYTISPVLLVLCVFKLVDNRIKRLYKQENEITYMQTELATKLVSKEWMWRNSLVQERIKVEYCKLEKKLFKINIVKVIYVALLSPIEICIRLLPKIICITMGVYYIHKGSLQLPALFFTLHIIDKVISPFVTFPDILLKYKKIKVSADYKDEIVSNIKKENKINRVIRVKDKAILCLKGNKGNIKIYNNEIIGVQCPEETSTRIIDSLRGRYLDCNLMIFGNQLGQVEEDFIIANIHCVGSKGEIFPGSLSDNLWIHVNPDKYRKLVDKLDLNRVLYNKISKDEIGEGNNNLSDGQVKLISIARALILPSKLTVIMNPMLGLDVIAQKKLCCALEEEKKDKSVLVLDNNVNSTQIKFDREYQLFD